MAEVTVSGPLAVYRSGPDEPVPLVLLHGFPLDALMWEDVVMRLPDVPIITVDAPGFGDSPSYEAVAASVGATGEPALETYADAVVASLRNLGLDRAAVVGLSMGGYVTLAIAERHPALVAGIGLLDTKAAADEDAARANRLRVADAAEGDQGAAAVAPMVDVLVGPTTREDRPDLVREIEGLLAAAPPAGIAWAQRAMAARPDRLDVLRTLAVPGLVLRGAEDPLSTMENVEAMAAALADSDVIIIPSSGHMTAIENPDPVAEALRRLWLRSRA
jgi:pimeloyl-ACP methyl ester carboxylesterase